MSKTRLTIIAAAALTLVSCSRAGWSVEGTVEGAPDGTKLALEAYNAGRWYVLDSVEVKRSGRFEYKADAPMTAAEILRLQLSGKGSVYFPIEGKDAVKVEASAETFGTGHRLSGTALAERVSAVDSTVAATSSMEELQRKLASFVTTDTTGLIAYYTVGKSVGNRPVFDPNENLGNRVYGAAAQVFAHYKPLDARGAALRQAYFEGRKALGKLPAATEEVTVEVPETAILDIVRYDDRGVSHSLADVASQGKVVLLSFTNYSMESSPAYNAILNDLYKLYSPKGFEIYQIAFDGNEVSWKDAARNLPWITVWNSESDGVEALALYNVGALPTTYIINSKGEISKRVQDPTTLPKEVAKYF